jgi:hypothetical protein
MKISNNYMSQLRKKYKNRENAPDKDKWVFNLGWDKLEQRELKDLLRYAQACSFLTGGYLEDKKELADILTDLGYDISNEKIQRFLDFAPLTKQKKGR